MKLEQIFVLGNVLGNSAPPARNLYRVKRDQNMSVWHYQVRDTAPNPAVNRTGELTNQRAFTRSAFDAKWQFFWVDLLAMQKYNRTLNLLNSNERRDIVHAFDSISSSNRAFNNKKGTDNCNNYVESIIRSEDPAIDPLICADSIVEVLETKTSISGITAGLVMARLRTFDQHEMPPAVTRELLDNDTRILTATIINKDGTLQNFPQLTGMRNPYPYISAQDCWFPLQDLEKVTA